jgi:hypothetical protein
MHQPSEQLQLFEFFIQPEIKAIHDPYWDEITNNVGEQVTWADSPCNSFVRVDFIKVAFNATDSRHVYRLSFNPITINFD